VKYIAIADVTYFPRDVLELVIQNLGTEVVRGETAVLQAYPIHRD
jgi:hypothetical protein